MRRDHRSRAARKSCESWTCWLKCSTSRLKPNSSRTPKTPKASAVSHTRPGSGWPGSTHQRHGGVVGAFVGLGPEAVRPPERRGRYVRDHAVGFPDRWRGWVGGWPGRHDLADPQVPARRAGQDRPQQHKGPGSLPGPDGPLLESFDEGRRQLGGQRVLEQHPVQQAQRLPLRPTIEQGPGLRPQHDPGEALRLMHERPVHQPAQALGQRATQPRRARLTGFTLLQPVRHRRGEQLLPQIREAEIGRVLESCGERLGSADFLGPKRRIPACPAQQGLELVVVRARHRDADLDELFHPQPRVFPAPRRPVGGRQFAALLHVELPAQAHGHRVGHRLLFHAHDQEALARAREEVQRPHHLHHLARLAPVQVIHKHRHRPRLQRGRHVPELLREPVPKARGRAEVAELCLAGHRGQELVRIHAERLEALQGLERGGQAAQEHQRLSRQRRQGRARE